MSKNIQHLQHIKSNVVTEGKPKLPTPSVLVDGELAVNYAEGYETISLKNSNGSITTFSSDDYYTAKKLGSGFTGVNSANTVTSVIEDNEEAISAALNDLNERKMDASAYTPTDLSNYYTKSETYAKSETSGKTEIANAVNDLNERISSSVTEINDHVSNSDIHIKSGGQVIYNLTGATGVSGGTNKMTSWSGHCEGITELYDGMNVQIKIPVAGYATGDTLSINGGDRHRVLLNASTSLTTHYPVGSIVRFVYDANQSANVYTGSSTPLSVQGVWKVSDYDSNTNTIGYLVGVNQITYTVDAATYRYMLLLTKDETTLTPVNSANNVSASTKTLTTSEFDPFGGIYYKSSTTTVSAGGNLATGTVWTQYSLNLAYSFNTTNTLVPQKAVYIVAVPQANGKAKLHTSPITQTLPTSDDGLIYIFLGNAYSNTSIILEINHPVYIYKNGKVRPYTMCSDAAYMDVESALTPSSSASTNLVTAKAVLEAIKDNEEVVASSLNDLNERKLDISAYTPTDLSNYYTKAETSGKTEIENALSGKADYPAVQTMDGYAIGTTNTYISATDTLNIAIGKLEKRCLDLEMQMETISQALNVLNQRLTNLNV